MKAAVLGAGFIAPFHAMGFSRAGCTVCAVCDTDESRARALAERFGCAWYTDARALFNEQQPETQEFNWVSCIAGRFFNN